MKGIGKILFDEYMSVFVIVSQLSSEIISSDRNIKLSVLKAVKHQLWYLWEILTFTEEHIIYVKEMMFQNLENPLGKKEMNTSEGKKTNLNVLRKTYDWLLHIPYNGILWNVWAHL